MKLEQLGTKEEIKNLQPLNQPKLIKKEEEYSYDEESLEETIQTIDDDDEDYTPWLESTVTRNSSKLSDQKSQARDVETRDLDISIYSSGSIHKDTKKGLVG